MIDNDMGLGAYDDAYDNVKILDRKVEIPDGQYDVVFTDAFLGRDKDQRPVFTLVMEVEEGDEAGKQLPLDSSFYDSIKLQYFKKAMIGLGMATIKPSDLQRAEVLQRFIGIRANVTTVTKEGRTGGKFLNIYINRRLDLVAPAQPARPAAPALVPSKVVGSIQSPASKPVPFDDSDLPF